MRSGQAKRRKTSNDIPARRRSYDSPLRQERAAQTRERIIAAGAKIAHRLPTWDWREVTFKAVGTRARVSERTVHRYFSSERKLRDAILQRLVEESGVTLDGMELSSFSKVVARVYEYLASFPVAPANAADPTFAALDLQRRAALLGAVVRATRGWSESEQEMAAAMLDMLWNVNAYERLMTTWRLDTQRAIRAISWMITLIETAIQQGVRPAADQ